MSLNALKISINQQIQIEQNSEKNNSEKVFIEKNKDWYEIVLQEIKKLKIKKNKKLIMCEWSH